MGCFLGCFSSSKDESKRRKNTHFDSHRNPENQDVQNQYNPQNPVYPTPIVFPNQEILEKPLDIPVRKSCVKQEEKEQLSLTNKDKPGVQFSPGTRKKVSFDSNVKAEEQSSSGVLKKVTFNSNVKPEEQLSPGTLKKVTFDSNVKPEEQLSLGTQKKVTFDSDVKSEEQSSLETPKKVTFDSDVKPKEQLSSGTFKKVTFDSNVKPEGPMSSGTRKKVSFNSNVKEYEHISYGEPPEIVVQESEKGGEKVIDEGSTISVSDGGSTLSSSGSFPPNHRYQNCRESDDEDEELDCEVSDLDEDEEDEEEAYDDEYSDDEYHLRQVQEFSARSCSSEESRTKSSGTCFVDDGHDDHMLDHGSSEGGTITPVRFNRGARDRAGYVHSVLNPVENTAQWKSVKVKATPIMKEQKENFQVDLGFQLSSSKSKPKLDEPQSDHEVAVDASLSTWIISSQKTPPSMATPISLEPILSGTSASSHGSNSMRSQEERPILGALTVEELKQFSATSSPRSPNRSPDERPLLGTVGWHWNDRTPVEDSGSVSSFKGIPNTSSKYREDKSVNWHSTPFETRLERALNRGGAEC